MQVQIPIFSPSTKLINSHVGVFEKDNFVYYLHNGSPIFCHDKSDMNNYRYITGNLVNTGLCTPIEIARALGVSNRNIQRYEKRILAKCIIKSNINLIPDFSNNTLTIELYSLATPRENKAVIEICDILNEQIATRNARHQSIQRQGFVSR